MLLVVLGAGASYDLVPEPQGAPHSIFDRRYFRPPLARELFERRPNFETVLYPQFSKAGPLVDDARQAILRGENLEDLLASYEERSQADPRARRQLLAARFYLQQTIAECANEWLGAHAGVTHYHSLLELLAREASPALFATFNYDLLIDRAFEAVLGRRFGSMSDYVDDPDFKLFKLHGSTDWGHPVAIDREGVGIPEGLESRLITAAPDLAPRPTFDFFRRREDVFVDDTTARIPAIAIPVASKSAFDCPKDHVALLTRLFPEVTAILVIGWRAGEAHFLALLKAVPRHVPVTIVSSNIERARETTKPLIDVVGLSSFHIRPDPESGRIVSPGFQGLIQSSWAMKRVDYARA